MFQHLKDEDKYLYHYTSIDKAADFILKNKTLMFNSLRGTNDPKEFKNWKFDFHIGDETAPSYDESMKLWEIVSEEIKSKCKILCFSKDKPGLGDDFFNDIYLRGFTKSRMWAQYGDNHKGVCLIFNKNMIETLISEQFGLISDLYGAKIQYKNRPLKGNIFKSPYMLHYPLLKELGVTEYVRRHIYTHNDELIFEKSLDWRDEEEHRYMILINKTENQYLNYGDSLCGVVFGAHTQENDQKRIFKMTCKDNVHFEKIKYSNSTPWRSFKDFRVFHT